jgi:hypothetical protein
MNRINFQRNRLIDNDLGRVVGPLADYICATDQPRAALTAALRVLFREVELTTRVASAQLAIFSEGRWS